MGYIGNVAPLTPETNVYPEIQFFSGNGSATTFQLSRPVRSVATMIVVVNNVIQKLGDSFSVNASNQIVFTSPPSTGSNNIYIIYQGTFNTIVTPPLGFATVGTTQIIDGAVNAAKIVDGSVNSAKLANGSVTAAKMDSTTGDGTGSVVFPTGTSGQRPNNPPNGSIRFNTTIGSLEFYSSSLASWQKVSQQPPSWITAEGSLGSRYTTQSSNFTLQATADNPVTYAVTAGSLPPGTSLNASTGAITGQLSAGAAPDYSATTYNFTVTATAAGLGSPRNFSITANSRFVGFRCSTAGENGVCADTAPSGFFFTRVDFSSYGTPNGSCGAFSIGGCNSGASNGYNPTPTQSYSVGANNGTWGDPCGGTPKRMYIQMSYGPWPLS